MDDAERLDEESEAIDHKEVAEAPKARRAFTKVRRELTEEELASPAAQRLILDELDQLEQQNVELSEFRDRFHKVDKEKAILHERMRKSIASEIIFGLCLTVGAALIGLTPLLWVVKLHGLLSLAIGVILIIGGVLSKAVQK